MCEFALTYNVMFTPLRKHLFWLNAQTVILQPALFWKTMSNLSLINQENKNGLKKGGEEKEKWKWIYFFRIIIWILCAAMPVKLINWFVTVRLTRNDSAVEQAVDKSSVHMWNPGDFYHSLNLHSIYREVLLKSQKVLITSSEHLITHKISTKCFPSGRHMAFPKYNPK